MTSRKILDRQQPNRYNDGSDRETGLIPIILPRIADDRTPYLLAVYH
jgi:hypothetical protein